MMDSEEKYAADLLRPLVKTPGKPSTVDIARAVAEGERRQRIVRLAGYAAVALAVVLVVAGGWAFTGARQAAPPAGPPTVESPVPSTEASTSPSAGPKSAVASCVLTRLPVPAGQPPKSVVTGADPTGRFIVGRSNPGGESHPVLIWDNGAVHAVAMSGSDQQLHDITTTGVGVGTSFVGSSASETAAWVYKNGRLTRLAGGVAEANAINERETIVGSVNDKPALWSSPTSQPTMLALPGPGWSGYAAAIDEDGTIVGRLRGPGVENLGYVWHPDGAGERLPVPQMRGKAASAFTADAIRDGWVIGWAALDDGTTRYIGAPRWNLRTGRVDTDMDNLAHDVNRLGWVLGQNGVGGMLVADGHSIQLPDLGERNQPSGTIPYTVSDDGTIVAGQVDLKGVGPVAARWTCR